MPEIMTTQDFVDGRLDVKSLGEAANGDENTQVVTRTGETYPSAKKAIKTMFENGGLPALPVPTKAKMITDGAASPDGTYAQVTDDTANNGLYLKTAGAWVKSNYDPVMQANTYTDEKIITDSFSPEDGKNLFDGNYVVGNAGSAALGQLPPVTLDATGYLAIIKIKPNTDYTVSKTESNRFNVYLSKTYPNATPFFGATIIKNQDSSVNGSFTFRTRADDNYVIVYVTNTTVAPSFLQLEEGLVQTSWVTYGYVLNLSEPYGSSETKVDNTVGNAKYLEFGLANAYTDSSKTTIATDDSDALQAIFNAGGAITLDANKIYAVSKPLLINLAAVKYINGNGATIVVTNDSLVLDILGAKTTTADAANATAMNMLSAGEIIHNLKITSTTGYSGQAVRVRNTFKLDLDIQCYFMRAGIVLEDLNRNIRLRPKAYAIQETALKFATSCSLHQGQFFVGDMSYCNKMIFMDNAELYNLQFIGGDYETASIVKHGDFDTTNKCVLHIRADTKVTQDIVFTGLTLESHNDTSKNVILDGGASSRIRQIEFAGCFWGNSNSVAMVVGGVDGLKVSGRADNTASYFIDIVGDAKAVDIDITMSRCGGLLRSVGDHTLTSVSGRVVGADLKGNLVNTNCNIKGLSIKNCVTHVNTTNYIIDTVGYVNINGTGKTTSLVSIAGNQFSLPTALNDIVKVTAATGHVRVQDNDCDKAGAYPVSSGSVLSSGNYAPSA